MTTRGRLMALVTGDAEFRRYLPGCGTGCPAQPSKRTHHRGGMCLVQATKPHSRVRLFRLPGPAKREQLPVKETALAWPMWIGIHGLRPMPSPRDGTVPVALTSRHGFQNGHV
jgi:hypothetical protein